MKLRILWGSVLVYMLAVAVAAITAPHKRLMWPLYLPIVAAAGALLLAARRR